MNLHPEIAEVLAGERRWCVVEGDSSAILPTMAERGVDHVICDPPYDAKTHRGGLTTAASALVNRDPEKANGIDFAHLASPADASRLLLRVSRRWVLAFCTAEQLGSYADGAGDAWIRSGIWDRVNPAPQITGDRPGTAVDAIAIMHRKGRKKWNGGGRAGIWRHQVEHGNKQHPTAKPEGLMVELVSLFTDPDDVILDPFGGSGTTGVAALRLGRRVILIERDLKYAAVARERLAAEEQGSTLHAARAGQVPLFAAGGAER